MNIDNYIFVKENRGELLVRGITDDNKHIDTSINFEPTLYIESQSATDAVSLYGQNLKEYKFANISEAKTWKKRQSDLQIPIYGDIGYEFMYMNKLPKSKTVTKNDIKVLYYDIETEVGEVRPGFPTPELAEEQITAITTYDNYTKQVHVFTYKHFNSQYNDDGVRDILDEYDVKNYMFTSEKELLTAFLTYWVAINPHMISGWNIDGFDNLYIYNRIKTVLGETNANKLSPFGMVKTRKFVNGYGSEQTDVELVGVVSFDYLELYKTFTFTPVQNYKLDTIAEKELGVNKLHHDGTFKDFYQNHWDKFIAYNIRDTILVKMLDDKLDLISVGMMVAYTCGSNLGDTFGTVKKLDTFVYNYVSKKGLVIPPNNKSTKEPYVGAYVMDPILGKHEAIVSFDLNSLYPHLIMEYNISPETLVRNIPNNIDSTVKSVNIDSVANGTADYSAVYDTPYTVAPNGAVYDQSTTGFLPEIMEYLYSQRKVEKKSSFSYWQKAKDVKEELKRRGIDI